MAGQLAVKRNGGLSVAGVRRRLALARTVPEIKTIRDQAEAIRRYAKQSRESLTLVNEIAQIKLRAERKAGKLLMTMVRATGRENLRNGSASHNATPTLDQLGVTRSQCSRWQLSASVPEQIFRKFVRQVTRRGEELTSAGLLDVARMLRRREKPLEPHESSTDPVFTSYCGDSGELMRHISRFYFRQGDKIADVSFGKGVFWKRVDVSQYDIHASDLWTCPDASHDFRQLPYPDGSFDVAVIDPPQCHHPATLLINDNYRNRETTDGMSHDDLMELYRQGMSECRRILRPKGLMIVKCKDEIESGQQRRSHIEIYNIAIDEIGLLDEELFVQTQVAPPIIQGPQRHPRKNHSFWWVFRKPRQHRKRGTSV